MSRATSLYLDVTRFVAAMLVFLFHTGYFSGHRVPIVGDYGSEGVIVFFVLSGLVIMYSAERKHADIVDYLIARLSRLWSVVIPALILTLLCDTIGQALDRGAYGNLLPLAAWKWPIVLTANGLFLSEIWNFDIWPGSNGVFWSLPFEFWYYMIFGFAYYLTAYLRIVAVGITACIAGPKILIALPVWLIGAVAYRVIRRRAISPARGWILWLGSFGVLIGSTWFGVAAYLQTLLAEWVPAFEHQVVSWPKSYPVGLLLAANFIGFNAISEYFEVFLQRGARWIRMAADSSFSLYLFHYPLILFFKALAIRLSAAGVAEATWLVPIFVYLGPLAVVFPLVRYWEDAKVSIASVLNRCVGRVRPA